MEALEEERIFLRDNENALKLCRDCDYATPRLKELIDKNEKSRHSK